MLAGKDCATTESDNAGMSESLYYFVPSRPDRAPSLAANAMITLAASGLACLTLVVGTFHLQLGTVLTHGDVGRDPPEEAPLRPFHGDLVTGLEQRLRQVEPDLAGPGDDEIHLPDLHGLVR